MMVLGPLGFATPGLLAALVGLPALWWLLRAVPPPFRTLTFPGTALLLGLRDAAPIARRSPWWLIAVRLAAVAALIVALAGPSWRPLRPWPAGDGPLLIVMDAGWAAAPGWQDAVTRASAALQGAGRRPAALWLADGQPDGEADGGMSGQPAGQTEGSAVQAEGAADKQPDAGTAGPANEPPPGQMAGQTAAQVVPDFTDAVAAAARLRSAAPQPWATRYPADPAAFLARAPARFDTLWIADGLDHPGRAALLAALAARGSVSVVTPARPVLSLSVQPAARPALVLSASGPVDPPAVLAIGPDAQGLPRTLARLTPGPLARTPDGGLAATVPIDLPGELRNRITRFQIDGHSSAGAALLADDAIRRRKVALAGGGRAGEGQTLLSPLHYVRGALDPSADLIQGALPELLDAAPDVVALVDEVPASARTALERWVSDGGTLIRFAGPGLAALADPGGDPLLPVRLRPGGRAAGGTLSWGQPRGVAPFAPDGVFAGLPVPAEVTVRAQLLPDPSPEVTERTLAQLTDGTPLVTRAAVGQGQVVLFHTSANAEWSNLALSGLFVSMLDRLVRTAPVGGNAQGDGRMPSPPPAGAGAGHWQPEQVLDGFGDLHDASTLAPVPNAAFAAGPAPGAPAGLYAAGGGGDAWGDARGGAGAVRRAALNAGGPLVPAAWTGARVEQPATQPATPLTGALLALAGALLALDAAASALARGRAQRSRPAP